MSLESQSDAQLIVRTLYHRVIHDGCPDGCFYENYAKILKALHQVHPEFFQRVPFPVDWTSFNDLLNSLVAQERANFQDYVDQRQRLRLVAVALMQFFGQLSIHRLWDPRGLISALWYSELSEIEATCRRGRLFRTLLVPFIGRPTDELELHVECACGLLQVIGGHGLDVLDASRASHCFKDEVVSYLTRILCKQGPGGQPLLGKRICFLLQNLLQQDWARQRPKGSDSAVVATRWRRQTEQVERRIDPQDGNAYTLLDLTRFYGRRYTKPEIQQYFELKCAPIEATQKRQHRSEGNVKRSQTRSRKTR